MKRKNLQTQDNHWSMILLNYIEFVQITLANFCANLFYFFQSESGNILSVSCKLQVWSVNFPSALLQCCLKLHACSFSSVIVSNLFKVISVGFNLIIIEMAMPTWNATSSNSKKKNSSGSQKLLVNLTFFFFLSIYCCITCV